MDVDMGRQEYCIVLTVIRGSRTDTHLGVTIPKELMDILQMAFQCRLKGVVPNSIDGEWANESMSYWFTYRVPLEKV